MDMPSLSYRRKRGDMIAVFKIVTGRATGIEYFSIDNTTGRTRGHMFKLKKFHARKDVRRHRFSQRVINDWNGLPESTVNAETVTSFKRELDKHWMATMLPSEAVEEYDPYKDERLGRVREVGNQAVWSLSTCKPGFGVDQLRDHSLETYWQSDGPQPHLINIQFKRKTTVQQVCIYSDFKQDESYTPNRVSIRAGTSFHDLRELEVKELTEPSGWVVFALRGADDRPLRTYHVQIAVITNHQNGRDTHMRQVRVHAPVEQRGVMVDPLGSFISVDCSQFACIR